MKLAGYSFPEDLYYDQNHYWAKLEGDLVTVGLTDYGQHLSGEIIHYQAPEPGSLVVQGKPFTSLEASKWVGQVYAPVSGTIVAVNAALVEDPSPINADPYGNGWLVKIKPSDLSELDNLLRVGTDEFKLWWENELSAAEEE
ncbi:MAG: glycine cleavage system protein H [Firmicutes bacterium]|nr:glycine cleavage system protein H [Bacillota bacterium]